MKRALILGGLALVLTAGAGAVWVRTAPHDPDRWHRMPADLTPRDTDNAALRVVEGDAARFARLDEIIRTTPRTRVLAGAPEDGMRSYVTRSAVMGFPDYTTVRLSDGELQIYARSRFGRSDLGVNARRVDGWLEALRQGG